MNNQELINSISEMNTVKMIHLLNESKHYPKSKKEVLIKDLTMILNYLKTNDSLLEIIEGKCCATFDDCKNADKTGWLFLAKKSKKYFSLIFDYDSSELKDIYTCLYFGVQNLLIQNDIENNYELIYVSEDSLKFENFLKPF